MYFYILKQTAERETSFPHLRHCFSGGAAMPIETMQAFEGRFGCPIYEGYGLTETTVSICCNRPGARKPGSVGKPLPGVELITVDDEGKPTPVGQAGEIIVRSANVMQGYWNRPEATAETIKRGWLYTGDIGHIDEDGFVFIVDRKKDLIIRGGFNVYPREVEEVLYEHPAVAAAAVIGVPHPTHGEEVAAAVQLLPGVSVTPEELREYTKERVAAYKYPRHVWIVDALPLGPTGKLLKRQIVPPPELGGS
jgi:long-chain acyl-CoA synthetase